MQKLAATAIGMIIVVSSAQAQTACDIAGGAVRLHLTSETCKAPLNDRGKTALAAARQRPAVMACAGQALGRIQAELREALKIGGEPGIKLWCDLSVKRWRVC